MRGEPNQTNMIHPKNTDALLKTNSVYQHHDLYDKKASVVQSSVIKKQRQKTIKRIIEEGGISTQAELTRRLIDSGFSVNQTTVSRDIKELGIIRARSATGSSVYGFQTIDSSSKALAKNTDPLCVPKNDRQNAIIKIISEENVNSQQELVERLKTLGLFVTQTTISRDIKDLGIIKVRVSDGSQKYGFQGTESITVSFHESDLYSKLPGIPKNDRQRTLIKIIDNENIDSQKGLVMRLQEKGYHVTQATVSRDIRDLGISKTSNSSGNERYALRTNTYNN